MFLQDLTKYFCVLLPFFSSVAIGQEGGSLGEKFDRRHGNYKIEAYGFRLVDPYPLLSDDFEDEPEKLSYVIGLSAQIEMGRGFVDFLIDSRGAGTNKALFLDQTLVTYRGLHYKTDLLPLTTRLLLGYAAVTRKETYLGLDPLTNKYQVGVGVEYEAYGHLFGFAYSHLDPTQKSDEVVIDALKMTLKRKAAQHALLQGQHQFAQYGLRWQFDRFWTAPLIYETPMLTFSVDHQATSAFMIEPSFLWFPNWRLWLRWSQSLTKDVDPEVLQAVSGSRLNPETLSYYGMGITWDH